MYDLVEGHNRCRGPATAAKWLEELLKKAIELDERLDSATPGSARPAPLVSRRPWRYFDRAKICVEQSERNPTVELLGAAIGYLKRALELLKLDPAAHDVQKVQGMLCQAHLWRSRIQSTAQEEVADLTAAIAAGSDAIALCRKEATRPILEEQQSCGLLVGQKLCLPGAGQLRQGHAARMTCGRLSTMRTTPIN